MDWAWLPPRKPPAVPGRQVGGKVGETKLKCRQVGREGEDAQLALQAGRRGAPNSKHFYLTACMSCYLFLSMVNACLALSSPHLDHGSGVQ